MASFELSARQPFNFHSVVNSHGWIQLAPFRFDEERRTLFYTDRLSNGRVLEYRVTEVAKGCPRADRRPAEQGGEIRGCGQGHVDVRP